MAFIEGGSYSGSSDYSGPSLEEQLESKYQDEQAEKRYREQGFLKRLVSSPGHYRKPNRPTGGDRFIHE